MLVLLEELGYLAPIETKSPHSDVKIGSGLVVKSGTKVSEEAGKLRF